MELYERKSKFTEMANYCHLCKPHDFMEVTEWHNGEGFDVVVSDSQRFSLTWGQWQALQALVAYRG
jgi:hypothetical protein